MIAATARPLVLLALLAALPAAAQETAPAADAAPAAEAQPSGETAGGVGSIYVGATHGDWELRCERTESGADPCTMHQVLANPEGQPMAEITLFDLPPGGEAAAGASVVTPIETLLNQNLTIQVAGGQAKRYPFTFCFATPLRAPDGGPVLNANGVPEIDSGCVARVGFTAEEVEAFRKGSEALVTVFAVNANQPFTARMSLRGFTAGFAAMQEASAKVAPAASE
jgi:invasion protein IalB